MCSTGSSPLSALPQLETTRVMDPIASVLIRGISSDNIYLSSILLDDLHFAWIPPNDRFFGETELLLDSGLIE